MRNNVIAPFLLLSVVVVTLPQYAVILGLRKNVAEPGVYMVT